MNRVTYKIVLSAAVALLAVGCLKPQPVEPCEGPVRIDVDPKVFIMYDNIGSWFNDDVAEAARAVASGALADQGHRVVIFHRGISGGNEIYELVKDDSPQGYAKKTLKKYASDENNSLDVETISSVVRDIRALTPEANHYGLTFGSHGSGWVPKDTPLRRRSAEPDIFAPLFEERENTRTRALSGYWDSIDISEFGDALDGEPDNPWEWDFIIFDDCFMASIEALYEIRHLADYFIASPTEILDRGFPYDRVVKTLFSDWNDYGGIVDGFVDYYLTVPHPERHGMEPYATISVVKASELDALAEATSDVVNSPGWTDVDPSLTPVQFYEGHYTHVFYDLDQFISTGIGASDPLYAAFSRQLEKTVVFSDHTPSFFSEFSGGTIPVNNYCGLSSFILWSGTVSKEAVYKQTPWYEAVYNN